MKIDGSEELAERYALALEAVQIGEWSWDAQTDAVSMDTSAQAVLGMDAAVVGLSAFRARVHPDDGAKERGAWSAALDPLGDGNYRCVLRFRRGDKGDEILVLLAGQATFADGRAMRIIGILRDMTERHALTTELKKVSSQLAGLVSISEDAIVSVDDRQRITLFNNGAEAIFGYTRDEIIGQPLAMLLPEESRVAHAASVRAFGDGPRQARRMGERSEVLGRRKGGETFQAEASISRLDIDGSRIYTAVLRDVTLRRAAERELQQGKEVLELALDGADIGLFEQDHESGSLFWSPIFRRMCGIGSDDAPDMEGFVALVHEDDRRTLRDALAGSREARTGGRLNVEFRVVRPDGLERWLAIRGTTTFKDGVAERSLGVVIDVTQRRQSQKLLEEKIEASTRELKLEMRRREESQAQLVRTQRLEAFGQLTGGIAHDFNNLLTVITGNLELLDMRIENEKQRVLLKRAHDAAEMGARLTGRLLTFARRRNFATVALNLNEQVIGMAELLERTLGEPITLTTVLERKPWTVLADASEIENAILNLAINARDAMPAGGKLVIETANVTIDGSELDSVSKLLRGDYVRLSISDTGVGMSPEILAKVFEPFFTTKEPGKGTGLGLSTLFGFVKQAGGDVMIYSEMGLGTTVNVYLPRSNQAADTDPRRGDPTVPQVLMGKRVLLVEDNPEVRLVSRAQLETLGCVVTEAGSGPEAIEVLKAGARFDVVFSDVVMAGGLSGFDVAAWVRAHIPNSKLMLASGYPDEVVRMQAPGAPAVELLRKPYSRNELAQALGRVLDA